MIFISARGMWLVVNWLGRVVRVRPGGVVGRCRGRIGRRLRRIRQAATIERRIEEFGMDSAGGVLRL